MKRLLCFVFVLLALTGCGAPSGGTTVSDLATPTTTATAAATVTTAATAAATTTTSAGEPVDVDLTRLSSTMVYAEVYNMTVVPEQYIGKSIKMNGACDVYHDETTGKTYYACIIKDALECCATGIEFELTEGHYPEKGDEVTVTGTFDTYQENGATFAILRHAARLA